MTTDDTDLNDLAYWFPKLYAAGLPMPRTEIIQTSLPLVNLLDGEPVPGFDDFIGELQGAVARLGIGADPFFLRTGHTSGKHRWKDTCYVKDCDELPSHVVDLVEESMLADIMGLPVTTWVVRELLPTAPIFSLIGYGDMPVVPEFRYFVRGQSIAHIQPYWPPDALEQGMPRAQDWRERIVTMQFNSLHPFDKAKLDTLARRAGSALGGYWSVDFLQDEFHRWWLTDCALGEQSFMWSE